MGSFAAANEHFLLIRDVKDESRLYDRSGRRIAVYQSPWTSWQHSRAPFLMAYPIPE